jgi:CBS domain-containing protein
MLIKEIMCKAPTCCTPETMLPEIARMMLEHDCGAIPVCNGTALVGVITDRDIVCRAMAIRPDLKTTPAADAMTSPVVTVNDNDSIQRAVSLMAENKVRRLPVVKDGVLVGMLTQADLAEHLPLAEIGSLVRKVSASTRRPLLAV